MPTNEYYNGQRSPPCVPKTGSHLQWITKTVLGCQKTNWINPKSAIRQQQQQQQQHTVKSPLEISSDSNVFVVSDILNGANETAITCYWFWNIRIDHEMRGHCKSKNVQWEFCCICKKHTKSITIWIFMLGWPCIMNCTYNNQLDALFVLSLLS
jgi:hypothetical protein